MLGFLPGTAARVKQTVLAVADELTDDALVLRYRTEATDDGLCGEERTFTICSVWLVSALVEIGELDQARLLCENLLSHASPLQLYAEEIDARTGRQLGRHRPHQRRGSPDRVTTSPTMSVSPWRERV